MSQRQRRPGGKPGRQHQQIAAGNSTGKPGARVRMMDHLHQLAADTGAVLTTWSPPPGQLAEVTFTRGDKAPPEVFVPVVRTRREYYAGLHEFGHVCVGRRNSRWDDESDGEVLFDEAAAWVWAFDHAIVPLTASVAVRAANCLFSYALAAFDYHGPGFEETVGAPWESYGAAAVPDEWRDEYLDLVIRFDRCVESAGVLVAAGAPEVPAVASEKPEGHPDRRPSVKSSTWSKGGGAEA